MTHANANGEGQSMKPIDKLKRAVRMGTLEAEEAGA